MEAFVRALDLVRKFVVLQPGACMLLLFFILTNVYPRRDQASYQVNLARRK